RVLPGPVARLSRADPAELRRVADAVHACRIALRGDQAQRHAGGNLVGEPGVAFAAHHRVAPELGTIDVLDELLQDPFVHRRDGGPPSGSDPDLAQEPARVVARRAPARVGVTLFTLPFLL